MGMTNREKTLDWLYRLRSKIYVYMPKEWLIPMSNALDVAIKALEQEPRWIPVSERLPEEHEWIGTKTFGTTISDEVYVTFENPKGERFTEHLSFQNGKVSNFVQREIDALHKGSVPIAWMPLPKPYEPQESKRWKLKETKDEQSI